MSNKLILDLTVRLTEALDQNYDVVNMDTVLAVISALEGATITKEQLETTRLAKHINQLRRRTKSNILAIRAKNLLKKWREMFGITSQAQSEGATSSTSTATLSAPKPAPLLCISQPASPCANSHMLGDQFDNSLSSIGVEFSRTTKNTSGSTKLMKQTTGAAAGGDFPSLMGSRSNGALGKSANRHNNASLPATTPATNKVHHPTSFKNLISGISSVQSPTVLPPAIAINDDERYGNQLQPSVSSSSAIVGGTSASPRTHKSMKRKEQNSNIIMSFLDQNSRSSPPATFENLSQKLPPAAAAPPLHHSSIHRNQSLPPSTTIDLAADSDSSSNFAAEVIEVPKSSLLVAGETTTTTTSDAMMSFGGGKRSKSNGSSNKRIRKDKIRSNERFVDTAAAESAELFQPPADESSRIAFPISGIQEYLSLSNSSMSIFPAGSGAIGGEEYDGVGGGGASGAVGDDCVVVGVSYQNKSNDNQQPGDLPTGRSNYLSFAGKFKHNSVGGIDVVTGTVVKRKDGAEGLTNAAKSAFLPFSRNSNESSSNSQISQLDLVDVINQDSQSMITVDDLRDKQSSNEITSTSPEIKFPKDVFISNHPTPKQQHNAKSVALGTTNQQQQRLLTTPSSSSTSVLAASAAAVKVQAPVAPAAAPTEQKVLKKRGRKKGSKGIDSVLAQAAGLNAQFLMSPALGSTKKVKTTRELLIDIQSRKMGSTTSSPTLMNWFGTSRPASSCSEPSLHSPKTSDANSTNATTIATLRSSPEKNTSNNSVGADEVYASDSDTNTSDPSNEITKRSTAATSDPDNMTTAGGGSSIEKQIKELLAQLPQVDASKIDWETYECVPCTCTLREILPEFPAADNEDAADRKPSDNFQNVGQQNNDDDEPVISVSLPLASSPQKPALPPPLITPPPHISCHHSQSAPVSTVTSPVAAPKSHVTADKPTKSIFDLDFDDDNDPLHMFVEAASKVTPPVEQHNLVQKEYSQTSNEHKQQSESETKPPPRQQSPPLRPIQQEPPPTDPMPLQLINFPTYEVIEDSQCKAKQRYEIQTNQVTEYHVNAFHNCYIPNVNGNWDHSILNEDEDEGEEIGGLPSDDSRPLYANVVPKYGCLVKERIPKDLSFMKFTRNFKPKLNRKKSDKSPPLPFLGVANIHRRQHFRLHHYHRKLKKKQTSQQRNTKKQKKNYSTALPTANDSLEEVKKENLSIEVADVKFNVNDDVETKVGLETASENTPEASAVSEKPPNSLLDSQQMEDQGSSSKTTDLNDDNTPPCDAMTFPIENDENKSSLLLNGTHLMNNNNIIKSVSDRSCQLIINNHNKNNTNEDDIAASRRSSSCSNSSLKQNQLSINMKLRQHRSEHVKRKRKSLSSLTSDVFPDTPNEEPEQLKAPSLIKRIKIVNGSYTEATRRLTNSSSCLDDDNDSDCFHVHSENDVITEEDDDDEDFYDEDDGEGDDENENDEMCGVFHEVVTRDMMSSTTGNNHIVLTIKKTPSKTNSPSSSSRSPAPPPLVTNTSPTAKNTAAKIDSVGNHEQQLVVNLRNETTTTTTRVQAVDLVTKTDFFLPQAANLSVYNFQLNKCGDNDGDKSGENDLPLPFVNEDDEENEQPSAGQQSPQGDAVEAPDDVKTSNEEVQNEEHTQSDGGAKCDNDPQKIAELSQLTGKHIRRIKLRKSLREGIEQAKKLHRQLFFPCELHTSTGLKILEIQSCTSGCTDASSDNETTTDGSHTELTTSSSSGNGNLKTRTIKKRRRIKKLLSSKCNGGGGGNPPSSSSSSSSSPSSSGVSDSSSASAFTSWTTTDEDDDAMAAQHKSKKKKLDLKQNSKAEEEERKDKVVKEEEEKDEEELPELPAGNNFLLRSFNHIYVSTRERQRQEQLKKAPEYQHHREVFNSSAGGYITLSGDDSENQVATAVYDVNPRYNNKLPASTEASESEFPSKNDDEKQPLDVTIEEEEEKLTAVNDDGTAAMIKSENTNKEADEDVDGDDFVAQEEYRTGIRRVDEDVVDEDGNNCARTQQFKEWHEVLQLRSYNDELLTVLPYVVIE